MLGLRDESKLPKSLTWSLLSTIKDYNTIDCCGMAKIFDEEGRSRYVCGAMCIKMFSLGYSRMEYDVFRCKD